jgi:hypothetical protein
MEDSANFDKRSLEISPDDEPNRLRSLAGVYDRMLQDDVAVVAGEAVPKIIETSERLATTIEQGIGLVASSQTVGLAMLEVDPFEGTLISRARHLDALATS